MALNGKEWHLTLFSPNSVFLVISDSTDPSPSFDLGEYLSTSMLDAEGGKPVVVMNCFRFHPAILDNPHHSSIFRDIIGSEGQGVDADIPGWYASVGLLITGGELFLSHIHSSSTQRVADAFFHADNRSCSAVHYCCPVILMPYPHAYIPYIAYK